jgi:hypothetical protein
VGMKVSHADLVMWAKENKISDWPRAGMWDLGPDFMAIATPDGLHWRVEEVCF